MNWDELMKKADRVFDNIKMEEARKRDLYNDHLNKVVEGILEDIFRLLMIAVGNGETSVEWTFEHHFTDVSEVDGDWVTEKITEKVPSRVEFSILKWDGQTIHWKAEISEYENQW